MIDDAGVRAWVAAYERAWRTAGTEALDALFTADASYRMAPFREPHRGLAAIRVLWDAERAGPDEKFEMQLAADRRCRSFEEWAFSAPGSGGQGRN